MFRKEGRRGRMDEIKAVLDLAWAGMRFLVGRVLAGRLARKLQQACGGWRSSATE
jgi:hypothetical protein